jgi:hypothetical protein
MRILRREKIKPINVLPGDAIELSYDDGHGNKSVVLRQTILSAHTFDMAAVFELDPVELKELELSDALGGFFGKESD